MLGGYVGKRRGIVEHLQAGRLTLLEYGAYDLMILLADKCTGIWMGSAKALAANCGAGDLTERQARHMLESLEKKGYIRRFPTRRSHGNYTILINKYLVRCGALSGMRLNAAASDDWRNPVYEKCLEQGTERAPIREKRRETKDKNQEKRPAKKQQADPRFQPIVDAYFKDSRERGIEPEFDASDGQQLKAWLKRHLSVELEKILATLENAFLSTDPFPLRLGFRLREFLAHQTKYQLGPLNKPVPGNGRPTPQPWSSEQRALAHKGEQDGETPV